MKVKTSPYLSFVEEWFEDRDQLNYEDSEEYQKLLDRIEESGHSIKLIKATNRSSTIQSPYPDQPRFSLGGPIKLLTDWDPELGDYDMKFFMVKNA